MGSRAPIAISLLVKNPDAEQHGQIYFHDIGDYLTREEERFNNAFSGLDKKAREARVDGFINTDPTRISWTRAG